MFITSLIIFLGGASLLSVSVWLMQNTAEFTELVSSYRIFRIFFALMITSGGLMVVIGFFGCCLAFNEDRLQLGIYCGLVFSLFVIKVSTLAVILVKRQELKNSFRKSILSYGHDKKITRGWDLFQKKYHCCGFDDQSDWLSAPKLPDCYNDGRSDFHGSSNATISSLAFTDDRFKGSGCVEVFNFWITCYALGGSGCLILESLAIVFCILVMRVTGVPQSNREVELRPYS